MPDKMAILLILLVMLLSPRPNADAKWDVAPTVKESIFDKKQDKGPVLHPLRQKPFMKRMYKA